MSILSMYSKFHPYCFINKEIMTN